jgi:hypothetical protein
MIDGEPYSGHLRREKMRMLKKRSTRLTGLVVLAMTAGAFLVWAIPAVAGLSVFTENQVSGTARNWVARNSDDFDTDDVRDCTSVTAWNDIDDTRLNFHTSAFHQRVLVDFVGSFHSEGDDNVSPQVDLSLKIDGNLVNIGSGATEVQLAHVDNFNDGETRGFSWISEELHPGSHVAEFEWQLENGNSTTEQACVTERSTRVFLP